ncbi:MAG TPA: hypothetical protein VEX86_13715 [Longimicrobium sp.]|nr:hypothetical protein [Longimicrobium sp.]
MTFKTLRRTLGRWRLRVTRKTRSRNDEAYLLSSPANAARLRSALEGARKGTGTAVSISDLRSQHGLGER